jgi:cell division transport system permease protein
MRSIRIIWRILKETYQSIKFSGMSNFMVISILTVTLALFGGVLQFNSSIKQIYQNLDNQLEFSIYLIEGAETKAIAQKISQIEAVKKVDIIPKDIAWRSFRDKFGFSEDSSNPLPDTLHVNVKRAQDLNPVIEQIKNYSGIEQISYAPQLFQGLRRVRSILFSFGLFITLILAISTITIISNTIQLIVKSRSLEIKILRLVGVDDWYIRGPFITHGIFYGLVSSLIAIIPLLIFQNFVWNSFQASFKTIMPLTFSFDSGNELGLIFVIMFLTGIIVCGTSSYMVTNRYIKV